MKTATVLAMAVAMAGAMPIPLAASQDVEPCGKIACEGKYKGHLQGVATDGESLFWSFTVKLVKTDPLGKILAARDVPSHHGDLCCADGKVYVAVNRGRFNQLNSAVSEVRAYDCATLEAAGVWDLPDMPHGAGGMTCRAGKFYVVGGLPATDEQNHVYEYTDDFKLQKRHDLDTGFTLMGIQTAEWDAAAGRFLFGIYGGKGNPPGVIAADAALSGPVRHVGPGNLGLLHIGGRLFVGGMRYVKDGCEGWIEPAAEDALSDTTRYVPAKSDGSACIRFFFEGRHGSDWNDAGYDFDSSGYSQLSECKTAFVPKGETSCVWPAVGIGGKRPVSVPDLVRGVRRAAECGETLSFHLPGDLPDISEDASLSEAVGAICREASALGVRIVGIDDRKGHENKRVPILGYQLDISRCKVPTMETLFRIVDIMAKLGYNHFELYTEHTFAYKGHETVWREASPMTPEEVRALDDYCHVRGIELVPNQNSFGHLEKWLQHPEYNDLADHPQGGFRVERWNFTGKRPATLNPIDPRSLHLVAGLYDQLFPCFRSKLVNVGCDETIELEDSSFAGRSGEAVREKGPARVYLDFLKKIYAEVKSRNHTMMFWGDIVLHYPELVPDIPDDAICLNWGYEANHPFEKECGALASAGRKFIVCPGTSAWGSLFGRVENMTGNIRNAVAAGKRHGAQGYLLADWGDGGNPQPWIVSLPALVYFSHYVKGEEISMEQLASEIDGICGCKCGAALLAYGGVYLKAGGRMGNSTELYRVLRDGSKYRRYDGVTDESLAAAFEECGRAKSLLCLDGAPDWVKDDFALLDILARAVEVRITEPDRPNFRAMFEPEYRRLWLRQNRLGGLKDSLAILFGM